LSLVNKLISWLVRNLLRVRVEDSMIAVPVDMQARYKSPGLTLYTGTVTSSGNTTDIDLSLYSITTPTLDVYVEGKFEATGDYKVLASQTGITSTGVWFLTVNLLVFRFIRVRWVVGGVLPSFTFTIVAQAMV
jgi:hypothetical protein